MKFATVGLHWVGVALLALPWLVPPVFGPSPAVVTLLLAWGALGAYGLLVSLASVRRDVAMDIASGWVLAATLSSFFALCQYFDWASLQPWISPAQVGEAYGNLRQRNQFATLSNIGLAVLLLYGLPHRDEPHRAGLLAVLLLVAANAASSSRTGLLQLLMLLAIHAAWVGTSRALRDPMVRAAVVGYALAAIFFAALATWQHTGGGIWGRVQETVPACSNRLVLWSNVLYLIEIKPWTGWGWGELGFAHFTTLYPGERFCDILDNAHNLPLHLAVELGVPLAVAICSFVLWCIARLRPWAEREPLRRMAWAVLALLGLHSLLEYPLWYGPFQLALGTSVWLVWRPTKRPVPTGLVSKIPGSRVWHAYAATFLIAIVGWVGWNYWRISQLYLPPEARAAEFRDDTFSKVQDSWLFQNQVKFAALTTAPLTRDNAEKQRTMALELLHFSPEPTVVQRLVESAVMLGRDEEALYYLQRFKAAFPQAHGRWGQQ